MNKCGHKTSEFYLSFIAFLGGMGLAIYGIYEGVDLLGLAGVITSVGSPIMTYAFGRAKVKAKE